MAADHSVILTAPADNQSGRGGYIAFLQPVPMLAGTERAAIALGLPAGTSGVGTDPSDPDVHYVNGTPVAACLYGIDVQAPRKWGGEPDLVISGPNEGNNTGHITASSGTFNNLLYVINRGLPGLAVSDAVTTQVTWSTGLPSTHRVFEVAGIVLRVIDELVDARPHRGGDDDRHRRRSLLPEGIGLNVNIPLFSAGFGSALPLTATHIGVATAFSPAFFERLSDSPIAVASGVNFPVPGISLAPGGTTLPSGTVVPADDDPRSEGNVVAGGTAVAISPVIGVPEAGLSFDLWLKWLLRR